MDDIVWRGNAGKGVELEVSPTNVHCSKVNPTLRASSYYGRPISDNIPGSMLQPIHNFKKGGGRVMGLINLADPVYPQIKAVRLMLYLGVYFSKSDGMHHSTNYLSLQNW